MTHSEIVQILSEIDTNIFLSFMVYTPLLGLFHEFLHG